MGIPSPIGSVDGLVSVALTGPFDTAQLPRIADEPVTITVARTVAPGHEDEFQRWADEVVSTVRRFPGFLGAGVYHPGPDGGDYQTVFRFVDGIHLRNWERSPLRAEGVGEQQWVLIDYGDVVVHVFLDETRVYYEIERLYRDVPRVEWERDEGDA